MADRDMTIERIEREVSALRDRLAAAESRLPPMGWESNGYTSIANPGDSLCRDCVTGRWSVWRYPNADGKPASEGATAAEAIKGLPRVSTFPPHP